MKHLFISEYVVQSFRVMCEATCTGSYKIR